MTRADALTDAPCVLTVDLRQIRANWQALARLAAPAECGAVVKADAYGLGAKEVIPALAQAGCRTFFVATAAEAQEARRLVPQATLYVLDGLVPGSAPALIAANARPVLSSLDEIYEWAESGALRPAALHCDTGLNRLGLSPREAAALAANGALLEKLDLRLLMSHLACADQPDHPMNQAQLAAFRAVKALWPSLPASLAASDGLMLGKDYHFDLVRPGYALYGGQAAHGRPAPVKLAIKARARILQVREVEAGGHVGYGASFTADGRRRIAVAAVGYADGFARSASAGSGELGGAVLYKGRRAPVAGRVSMDLITVDVTHLEGLGIARGAWIDLFGPELSLEEAGLAAKTIGYELLTRFGRRFHRIYLNGKNEESEDRRS